MYYIIIIYYIIYICIICISQSFGKKSLIYFVVVDFFIREETSVLMHVKGASINNEIDLVTTVIETENGMC